MNNEQKYILALSFIKGLGDTRINFLIQNFGSAKQAWESSKQDLLMLNGIGPKSIQEIGKEKYLYQADQEMEFCKVHQIEIVDYFSESYPQNLKECPDAPIILFTKGNINFQATKKIAIVGTRKMTNYGRKFIDELVDAVQDLDVTIVSGLAYGCDIFSHIKAIENKIPTWAVLAHNLNHIYPSQHKAVADLMLENGGWISEQPSFSGVQPKYFLKRNRIIAGLSEATILVESAIHGGSLVTSKFANDYNRDVFALPGKSSDSMSKGCNYLIKTHQAQLIESAEDLLYHLNLKPELQKPKQLDLFTDYSPDEIEVLNFLQQNGKTHIDSLALGLNKFSYELMPILLDLELNQVISPLPGKHFDLSS